MILTLTASIMYWSLQRKADGMDVSSPSAATDASPHASSVDGDSESADISSLSIDDGASASPSTANE